MASDTSGYTLATPDSPCIEGNLACAICGYNLRTLAWNSKCPECGTPAMRSGSPVAFHFYSPRSERRARLGIGLVALTSLVGVLSTWAMKLAVGLVFVAPPVMYSIATYLWVYAGLPMTVLMLAATLLITQPFAAKAERFKPRLAAAATVLALVGALGMLVHVARIFPGTSIGGWPKPLWVAYELTGFCRSLTYVAVILHLCSRVRWSHRKGLAAAMCGAFVAPVFTLCLQTADLARHYMEAPHVYAPSEFWWTFTAALFWLSDNIVPACDALLLIALLFFLRQLRLSPRQAS